MLYDSSISKDYPQGVQFETGNTCNSKCVFCPRQRITRNQEMPDDLIREIITQIKAWQIPPFEVKPFLNNEPFMDERMEWIIPQINTDIPNSRIVIFTNGSCFYPDIIQVMQQSKITSLHISLNEHRKDRYESLMGGMNFDDTLRSIEKCLEAHHSSPVAGSIIFHRVSLGNAEEDQDFVIWCRERFGEFAISVSRMANWKGAIQSDSEMQLDAVCVKPYTLTILSNGQVCLCCMDYDGAVSFGNARFTPILDIYNLPICKHYRETAKNLLYPCFRCNNR